MRDLTAWPVTGDINSGMDDSKVTVRRGTKRFYHTVSGERPETAGVKPSGGVANLKGSV
jgi:hypothetical protein